MPSPVQTSHVHARNRSYDGDIIISGMSGRFPDCENVEEFKNALYNGQNLIRDGDRWPAGYRGVVNRMGKLKNLCYLDASYFGIHNKLANRMDPQLRILLEATHEALVDAGVNPTSLRGSNTGVYVSVNNSEALDLWSRNLDDVDGYTMLGCHTSMMANRISHAFDFCGPSCAVNSACASSLYALDMAYKAIRNGDCDAAVVAASNLILTPTNSLYFILLGMVDPEGQSKPLENDAGGYVRAEGVVAIFVQKSSDSKRIYASILGVKTNADGYKEEGITFPSEHMQSKLVRELYAEIDLEPSKVSYIETHTGGTKVGDTQECRWIIETFCKNRRDPLLIGCVKSQMGHAEHASGLCSLVKMLLAMEVEKIPANFKLASRSTFIQTLDDGKLKVVVDNEPWNGGIMAMNAFGFGGTNSHLVLKSNPKLKGNSRSIIMPRIVGVSARTEDALHYFLDNIELNKEDREFLALVDNIHSSNIRGHPVRGFAILNSKCAKQVGMFRGVDRPVWFVYSGFGTQWAAMAKDLMIFDAFRKSLKRSAEILRPRFIDLEDIITRSAGKDMKVLEATVSITTMQVALTDLLLSLGISPRGIIGHSAGEIAAAYADGCLTADQAVLAAYARGYALQNTPLPQGCMAAVGLGWDEAIRRCPSGVYPVCDNDNNSVAISGPSKEVKNFVTTLEKDGVFARTIRTLGYAFHSEYIADSTALFRQKLEEVISQPLPRSSRWISTSVPEPKWKNELAKLASVDYFVNNTVSPVLFRQAMGHVPDNAIVIEVAPTGALQPILRALTGPNVTNISLMKRDYEDNARFFLSALGNLYIAGAQPQFGALYEPVTFPVSKGTTRIASMVQWDHSVQWEVPKYNTNESAGNEITVKIDLKKDPFYSGHNVDGKILFPTSGYLVFVWKSYANLLGTNYEETPVIFENVKFIRGTVLAPDASTTLTLSMLQQTGNFEIREKDTLVVTGKVYMGKKEQIDVEVCNGTSNTKTIMKTSDVYKELRLRGYKYDGIFCGITEFDYERKCGYMKWNNNWVTFMDNMIQVHFLCQDTRNLHVVTSLHRISIDPNQHIQVVSSCDPELGVPVYSYPRVNLIKSGGITVNKIEHTLLQRRPENPTGEPRLAKYRFVPYENNTPSNTNESQSKRAALNIISQIVAENLFGHSRIRVIEFSNNNPEESLLLPEITKMLQTNMIPDIEGVTLNVKTEHNGNGLQIRDNEIMLQDLSSFKPSILPNLIIILDTPACIKSHILAAVTKFLTPNGFILMQDNRKHPTTELTSLNLTTVAVQVSQYEKFSLLKKRNELLTHNAVVRIYDQDFTWVEPLKETLRKGRNKNDRVYLCAQSEDINGITGLVNCLRWESESEYIRSFSIRDNKAPAFSMQNYNEQLRKDLVHNVLQDGVWGCYCHVEFDDNDKLFVRESQFAYADILRPGDLSSIRWLQAAPPNLRDPKDEEVFVYYASLNCQDARIATGQHSPCSCSGHGMTNLGMEFSGRTRNGRRVMGLSVCNSIATTAVVNADHLLDVPDEWSLQEAATVPVAYATCYYALIVKGELQPGESILIHAGCGAVGMAAISIALDMNCTVFTTVSTQDEHNFLLERFPRLKAENVGNSRDTGFERLVLLHTNGDGVNLILNCLSGNLLHASMRCLSNGGRFLELAIGDIINDTSLDINSFLNNKSFHCISLLELMGTDYELQNVFMLIKNGIASGQVKPLCSKVFTDNDVEQAFRLLASTSHIGKVLVQMRSEESKEDPLQNQKIIMARPRTYMHHKKTYVIIGGLGGFGMELADWLVTRGAKNIILTTRSGIKTGYQHFCIRRWRDSNVNVIIYNNDAASEDAARSLLQQASKTGPIGGIFNVAFTVQDALMENQTKEAFQTVCVAKVLVSRNLDIVSRELAPDLDHFVLFSSIVSAKGNIGQSNYGLANSAMERLCEARWKCGLPSLAIQWGLLGDVGYVVEKMGYTEKEIGGTLPQSISSCLTVLDLFLQQSNPVVTSVVLSARNKAAKQKPTCNLIETVLNIVGVKDITATTNAVTLAELGMDSLMETEIKQTLENDYKTVLSPKEIRRLSISKLLELGSESKTTDTFQNGSFLQKNYIRNTIKT